MRKILCIFIRVIITLIFHAESARADAVDKPIVVSGDVLEVAGQRVQLYGFDAAEQKIACQAGRKVFVRKLVPDAQKKTGKQRQQRIARTTCRRV